METTKQKLLKPDEVGNRLNISLSKVYQIMRSGELPSYRIVGSYRIDEKDFDEFLKNNKFSSGPFSSPTKG